MNIGSIINTIRETNTIVRNNGFLYRDPIIWDSGFGYEIGYYVGPSKITYAAQHVFLVTGTYSRGDFHTTGKILHNNHKNRMLMNIKYGY